MITKWAHLPNAEHIDRVLASIKKHSNQWKQQPPHPTNAETNRRRSARKTIKANYFDRREIAGILRAEAWAVGYNAGIDVVSCLVAYDDCAYMMDSEVGELKILAAFGDEKAILLLPACIAFHKIRNLPCVK